MSLLSEFEGIERKKDDIVLSVAIELRAELVKSTPVGNPSLWKTKYPPKNYISGNLKASWTPIKKTNDGYVFSNTALYATIIFEAFNPERKNNEIGWIAQEYETVFPEDVTTSEETVGENTYEDFRTLKPDSVVPHLVKAVQELSAQVQALQARLDAATGYLTALVMLNFKDMCISSYF